MTAITIRLRVDKENQAKSLVGGEGFEGLVFRRDPSSQRASISFSVPLPFEEVGIPNVPQEFYERITVSSLILGNVGVDGAYRLDENTLTLNTKIKRVLGRPLVWQAMIARGTTSAGIKKLYELVKKRELEPIIKQS